MELCCGGGDLFKTDIKLNRKIDEEKKFNGDENILQQIVSISDSLIYSAVCVILIYLLLVKILMKMEATSRVRRPSSNSTTN